jgi:pimeloyl-ACP methyl ester carboxylesterase
MIELEHIPSSDGTPIAVWRSGSGPGLVLVHGTMADHTRWAKVAAGFEERFTIYAVDRRGRGSSGDAIAYSLLQEADDILAVLDRIDTAVNLLGHSYGALCCIEAALRTRRLQHLVLYEPPMPVGLEIVRPETLAKLDQLIERNEREAALCTFFREVVRVPEAQLQVMRNDPAWAARLAAAHTVSREIRFQTDYRIEMKRLQTMQTPTLLLLGADSPSFFHEATKQLHAAMPNNRIYEMHGQQHVAMDMIPDEFVRVVVEFLIP